MKKLLTITAMMAGVLLLGAGSASATWGHNECDDDWEELTQTYKPPCETTTTSTPTTTLPEVTTTVPATTAPTTTVAASTTTVAPASTVAVTTVPPTTAAAVPTTAAPVPATQSLPATGSENWSIAIAATLFLLLGGSVLLIARRTD